MYFPFHFYLKSLFVCMCVFNLNKKLIDLYYDNDLDYYIIKNHSFFLFIREIERENNNQVIIYLDILFEK